MSTTIAGRVLFSHVVWRSLICAHALFLYIRKRMLGRMLDLALFAPGICTRRTRHMVRVMPISSLLLVFSWSVNVSLVCTRRIPLFWIHLYMHLVIPRYSPCTGFPLPLTLRIPLFPLIHPLRSLEIASIPRCLALATTVSKRMLKIQQYALQLDNGAMQLREIRAARRVNGNDVPARCHEVLEVGKRCLHDAVEEVDFHVVGERIQGPAFGRGWDDVEAGALALVGDVWEDFFVWSALAGFVGCDLLGAGW